MPYSPIKLANHILSRARQKGHEVTPLQLMKLVYIAHGWSLHYLDAPLSSENAKAWQYGPVMPSLYQAVRQYRANPITDVLTEGSDDQVLSENASNLLDVVYDTYGQYTGIQLSNLTHLPGTPWSQTWEREGQNSTIPNDLIKSHYRKLAEDRRAA